MGCYFTVSTCMFGTMSVIQGDFVLMKSMSMVDRSFLRTLGLRIGAGNPG